MAKSGGRRETHITLLLRRAAVSLLRSAVALLRRAVALLRVSTLRRVAALLVAATAAIVLCADRRRRTSQCVFLPCARKQVGAVAGVEKRERAESRHRNGQELHCPSERQPVNAAVGTSWGCSECHSALSGAVRSARRPGCRLICRWLDAHLPVAYRR